MRMHICDVNGDVMCRLQTSVQASPAAANKDTGTWHGSQVDVPVCHTLVLMLLYTA